MKVFFCTMVQVHKEIHFYKKQSKYRLMFSMNFNVSNLTIDSKSLFVERHLNLNILFRIYLTLL